MKSPLLNIWYSATPPRGGVFVACSPHYRCRYGPLESVVAYLTGVLPSMKSLLSPRYLTV